MTEKITFEFLSEDIQKALELLKKVGEKAVKGIGGHKLSFCPIAKGYRVVTSGIWSDICGSNLTILEDAGWDEITYNSFMAWYDCPPMGMENRLEIRAEREDFLKKYLSQ